MFPLVVSIVMGLGTMGLTVAKRQDLLDAARDVGLLGLRSRATGRGIEGLAGPPAYVDTSAVIDGRITDVVALRVPVGHAGRAAFVLGELQHIADDSDRPPQPRPARSRHPGELQKDHRIDLELSDEDAPGVEAVDDKLVALAWLKAGTS